MSDLDIILEIENLLAVELPELAEGTRSECGYVREEWGWVTDVQLYNLGLSNLALIVNPLAKLSRLSTLNLRSNQISDIGPLKKLTQLSTLDLRSNQISDISALKELANLTELYLSNNQLSDISALKELKNLERLELDKNPIEEIPSWITDFNMNITWLQTSGGSLLKRIERITPMIYLGDNPIRIPPPEIIMQGKEAIRIYFAQLGELNQDHLFEAKMLIIGEPGAGKTTMVRKINNPDCHLPGEGETTRGIEVTQYQFPVSKEYFPTFNLAGNRPKYNFRLNLWDFGGQEIYKATHRFFLSKRALYALVADSRNEDTDFNYWLHIIEMFGGDSPLLIVINEKYQRKRNLDVAAMRARFLNISDVIAIDFAEDDKTRLYQLMQTIRYRVSNLPHIGSPIPIKWTIVRGLLEHDIRNTISLQEYLKICYNNGITKQKDALMLSQYFHDIGVFLHFQDDELLNKTIFLNPTWATQAAYKILDHPLLNENNGRFCKNDAKEIWSANEFELVRIELLQLMKKFFLTYEIENSGEYIVPERLPLMQPDYSWPEEGNLYLHYKYDFFMPKGILSQFIVQMHRYIRDHKLVWKRGVLLMRHGAGAEVIESYDSRNIQIKIAGRNCRDFMTIITEKFDELNAQYEKMKVEKLIPCNCEECKATKKTHFYEYQDLMRRIEKGKSEVECGRSYDMVNVRSLIDEVINAEMLSSRKWSAKIANKRLKKIFVSYSHKDKEWLEKVQTQFKVLNNMGIEVDLWDDTRIKAGMKWREEIEKSLLSAHTAILLVSSDFLASEFIAKDELPPLLTAAQSKGITILPVILKHCLFSQYPSLLEFQAINEPTKPLISMTENEQEQVFVDLANRIIELTS